MTPSPNANATLAPYAVSEEESRGRRHPEPELGDRSDFELDRTRILNCMAFRRLMHKTQVFLSDVGDHFRTRLTHTLEVAAQAQRLARGLRLNQGLATAVALAHDLGHAPFGHAGEAALDELMRERGGFEHNLQSLRVVDYLEHPYPSFRGLNLSYEVRESLIKHRTTYDRPDRVAERDQAVEELLAGGPNPPLEGQVANLADVVAYTLHDIEDGLVQDALTEEELTKSRMWREAAGPFREDHSSLPIHALRRPIIDRISVQLLEDARAASLERIREAGIETVHHARRHPTEVVAFSQEVCGQLVELQRVLREKVYRNHRVVRMDAKAGRLIRRLFEAYLDQPELMPERFAARVAQQGLHRVVCDYVAGMTDRFCQQEYQRLFAPFHFE